jgi:hypothetical protein
MAFARSAGIMMVFPALHLTVIALIRAFFHFTENSSPGIAGNAIAIVHTEPAFDPTAHQARQDTA